MPRTPATATIALAILTALLATACGSASDGTQARADAATASPTTAESVPADEASAPAETTGDDAGGATAATGAEATAVQADDAGAWVAVAAGAQRFAAALDHANQAIASCETDASAGADFEACVGRSYQEIADAAVALEVIVADASARAQGACAQALAATRESAAAMQADYTRAIGLADQTSRETIQRTLADDAQAYADAALAAESACMG